MMYACIRNTAAAASTANTVPIADDGGNLYSNISKTNDIITNTIMIATFVQPFFWDTPNISSIPPVINWSILS